MLGSGAGHVHCLVVCSMGSLLQNMCFFFSLLVSFFPSFFPPSFWSFMVGFCNETHCQHSQFLHVGHACILFGACFFFLESVENVGLWSFDECSAGTTSMVATVCTENYTLLPSHCGSPLDFSNFLRQPNVLVQVPDCLIECTMVTCPDSSQVQC